MIKRDSGPQKIAAKTVASPPRTKATGRPEASRRNMLPKRRIEINPISTGSPQFPTGVSASVTATISRPVTAKNTSLIVFVNPWSSMKKAAKGMVHLTGQT